MRSTGYRRTRLAVGDRGGGISGTPGRGAWCLGPGWCRQTGKGVSQIKGYFENRSNRVCQWADGVWEVRDREESRMTPWSLAELGHGAHDYSPDRSGEEKEAAKAAASVGSSLVIGVGHGEGAAYDQCCQRSCAPG